ncbi:hypothetical protein HPB50_021288 [Hyalomma asiaticum]|uniref:Uncharacterized protein n=1 Tax=Hyalomma asiaticum TaxID=266040 RepID=A0ACB7SRQ9_HYAAI|nr:hypothetical protein HPB50_021288 [Hyalomma asiaticum]
MNRLSSDSGGSRLPADAIAGNDRDCPRKQRHQVSAVSDDLKPAATGLIGAGGYGGYGGIGQGINGFQSGYGNAGFGKGYGGYSNYGNNKALAGGGFGKGSYGDGVVSAYGNQGLGQGGISNLAAHGLHGVSGATGFNHQGGVNKQFAGKGAARDQFNAGHNKATSIFDAPESVEIFAKEKVYAVDQSFQNGNRDAFNLGYGNVGGFTGQGGFGKQEKVNQYGNQQYGAFKGYGQGNYGKHGRTSFGEGAHGINNYGHAAGYGTQAQQGKGYGGYGHGGVGSYGGVLNRGYGGYGATQAVSPILARPIVHGVRSGSGLRYRARNRSRDRRPSWNRGGAAFLLKVANLWLFVSPSSQPPTLSSRCQQPDPTDELHE